MVEFDRSAFIGKFQEEAAELLQRLNEDVIALETDPKNRELIDELLRDAHTLKGSSRMVGLVDLSDVAHSLEDIMVRVRDGQLAYVPEMSDAVFEALDVIRYLAENAAAETDPTTEVDLVVVRSRLAALAEGAQAPAPVEPESSAFVTSASQAASAAAPEATAVCADAGDAGQDALIQKAARDDVLEEKAQQTIRVRSVQVDSLLNLIGEALISQTKAEQLASELRVHSAQSSDLWQTWLRVKSALATMSDPDGTLQSISADIEALDSMLAERRRELGGFVKVQAEDVARTSVVVKDLQEHAMQLRMLPVNTVFQTFPRAMRDLAKQYRKKIDLVIEGGDTELDKKVLEGINDPLVHIMRNAVDHGIEAPKERLAAGKPETGTVRLAARQEGDRIVIEIEDDGAGIDPVKVRAAAVRKGYLTEAEAASMSDREAMFLIFEPGFSTSTIITEISGRGVGMDVVREFVIERLKGGLDVHSELGKGTTFTLTIPLTLAVIRALMVRVGDRLFAMPTASIDETLRVEPSEIQKVEGREVIRRQRRTIPLAHLSGILGMPETTPAEGSKIKIATMSYSGHRMGFVVDGFMGEQQIVIKPLGNHLRKVENIAGVTILGAGEVVPILNVPDLMDNARTRSGQRRGHVAREERVAPARILVCEDSFTTRELERSIFETAGYEVETAVDGAAGLAKIKEGIRVDAVVTDVQMPKMSGFELTRAIKADPALAEIPVVIVTSLERDEEKAQGIEAGADAYITKSVFNQDTLLDTVESLIR